MSSYLINKASLEDKKFIFFEIGIIAALAIALTAFEWSGTSKTNKHLFAIRNDIYVDDLTPVTKQQEEKLIKPPLPVIDLVIAPDDASLPDQPELPSFEGKENERIKVVEPKEEKPILDSIFIKAEEMPRYHGKSYKEFGKFISQHFRYPAIAAENGIKGIVRVRFIINEKGDLVNATIVRSVHEELDNEVLRVVNLSDKWTPGKQHGIPVKVAFVFPIGFDLTRQ